MNLLYAPLGWWHCSVAVTMPLPYGALEKTLLGSSPTYIKRLATPWSLSSWLNFLGPLVKAAKLPNGTPPQRSAFAALIGEPRRRKRRRASGDRLPRSRRLCPAIFRFPRLFLPLLNRTCRWNRPQLRLKR